MGRVLLIDDDPGVRYALSELLADRGHEAIVAASGSEALRKLEGVEVAVVDLSMPEMDGLEVLRRLREREQNLPAILLTAHGSERVAVEAMKAGAYDYLTKPFDNDELVLVIERAVETHGLRVANRLLAAEQAIGRRFVADAPPMRRLLDAVSRIATKDVTVLLRGETGTGKELIASLIHAQSARSKEPLVRFNCAAIPSELAEAELFGHAKGAFTGAQGARAGFFAQADGGTLVLDEIGEVPLALQAKLLRAIQEGEIQPVGSGKVEKVDVRIVASTNRDLEAEVKAGRFRQDLYFRLDVVELVVPSLRERREDVAKLALEFARLYGEKFGIPRVVLKPELLAALERADWPGNVRQLENAVARMIALATGPDIDLSAYATPITSTVAAEESTLPPLDGSLSLKEQVEAYERGLIRRALEAVGGNQSEAARRLGVNRVTLIDKIHKYELG